MENLVENLFDLHLKVLREILIGTPFEDIRKIFAVEFKSLNYIEFISKQAHRLSFNSDGNLIGAYPVSPIPNDFKITVDGIGQGYAMCAVDALGIAYTFGAKTIIETIDQSTGAGISITIDPFGDKVTNNKLVMAYPNQGYTSLQQLVAENTQLATSTCPNILFYSKKNNLPSDPTLSILDFEASLEEAIAIFSQKAIKDHYRKSLE